MLMYTSPFSKISISQVKEYISGQLSEKTMKVRSWFGIFTLDEDRIIEVELFQKDIGSILERMAGEALLQRGRVAGVDLRDLALKYGFAGSYDEYDRMLHELSIRQVKKQVENAVTQDRQVIAAVEAIDDIDETANILAGRLKEWYMLNFNETNLKGNELACHIIGLKGTVHEHELKMMQSLASNLLGLYDIRLSLEEYLKENVAWIAPNLTGVAGHILGARLLCIAGSLQRLASMPSSAIQVLGANNALFKHLKGKATSPKHGVIFRHPYVNTAPKWQRGKIARAVASKISLAVRYDVYSGELKEGLYGELEKKVLDIKRRNLKPGKKKRIRS